MPTTYTYNQDKNVVYVTLSGELHITDVVNYAEEVLASEEIQDGFAECVDMRPMTDLKVSFTGLKAIADTFRKLKEDKGYKGSVIIAPDDLHFGIARMSLTLFQAFAVISPARSEEEAEAKLEEITKEA